MSRLSSNKKLEEEKFLGNKNTGYLQWTSNRTDFSNGGMRSVLAAIHLYVVFRCSLRNLGTVNLLTIIFSPVSSS